MTFRSLNDLRQRLVRTMQTLNYGQLENLHIRSCNPTWDPAPRIVRDVVLGRSNSPTDYLNRNDFELKRPVVEMFEMFDRYRHVMVERIEVQCGLPFRIVFVENTET